MGSFHIDVSGAIRKINNVNVYYGKSGIVALGKEQKDIIYQFIANKIFDLSQIYVPVKTGYLKSTGRIVRNSIGTLSIVYTAPYAKYVHEIIDNGHKLPTRAKFLEDAGYEVENEMSLMGLSFGFTFSMDINDTVALHLDSLSKRQFKFNKHYIDYIIKNFFSDKELRGQYKPEEVVNVYL